MDRMRRMKDVNGPYEKKLNEPDEKDEGREWDRMRRMKEVNEPDEKDKGSEWNG